MHCGSAPLFLLTWPFYSSNPSARLYASLIPMVSGIKLIMAGYGKNEDLVRDFCRS